MASALLARNAKLARPTGIERLRKTLALASYAYVLETGHVELEGPSKELMTNEQVKRLYLGG